jgi:hypothetical protein
MQDIKILVFGEDTNDCHAISHLIRNIAPSRLSAKDVQARKRPIVLSKNAVSSGKRRKMADAIAAIAKFESKNIKKLIVVVHRDCDECEPNHIRQTSDLEEELRRAGVKHVVPATPAWELEAWLMLFPNAVNSLRSCWRQLPDRNSVGHIRNAKEQLRRDLRPINTEMQNRCPDYSEGDCIPISQKIGYHEISKRNMAASASFEMFYKKIRLQIDVNS